MRHTSSLHDHTPCWDEGSISAVVTHELLRCYAADGTAVITGFSQIVGSIGDDSGSWLEQKTGRFDGHAARSSTADKDGGTGYPLDCDLG